MRGPGDARRAEHLVGLDQDAERPILAAGIGMIALGLLLVGVADLLERGLRGHSEHLVRIDLEAEKRHVDASGAGTISRS